MCRCVLPKEFKNERCNNYKIKSFDIVIDSCMDQHKISFQDLRQGFEMLTDEILTGYIFLIKMDELTINNHVN